MTATVPAPVQTHLDTRATRLARLLTITTRLGVVYRLTSHDVDIVFGGHTYIAREGFDATAIEAKSDMSPDTLEITSLIGAGVTRETVRAGLLDGARVELDLVRWDAPDDGIIRRKAGTLGEVTVTRAGAIRAELRGLAQALSETTFRIVTPLCDADLGSARCGVPVAPALVARETAYALGQMLRVATDPMAAGSAVYEDRIYEVTTAGTTDASAPTFDTTVGNTTADGTAVFTARQAWARAAEVATVTSRREFTVAIDEARAANTTWFQAGTVTAETGANAGLTREISEWDGTGDPAANLVRTFLPFPFDFEAGDALRLVAGCDKRLQTCRDKFANAVNFRGFPNVPGQDYVTRYVGG